MRVMKGVRVGVVVLALPLALSLDTGQPPLARGATAAMAPPVARAGGRAAAGPHLLVSPASLAPGAALTIAGTGYAAGEPVQAALDGSALATTPTAVTTDAQGNFIATIIVPDTVASGPTLLVVVGMRSRASARTVVEVRRPIAATWYFAGLDTRAGTRSVIAVLNPDNNPARVTVHAAAADGPAREHALTIGGHSRATLDLATLIGGWHTLLYVRLSADRRVVVAATTYRAARAWSRTPGVSAPRRRWYLAEGYVATATHTYLRLYNPSPAPARVAVRLLPQGGQTRLVQVTLGGDRGREISVAAYVRQRAVGAIITASTPVVVQRISTFGSHDVGTTTSSGVADTAAMWTFPVGIAPTGAQTFYAVINPDGSNTAAVTATFYDAQGRAVSRETAVMAPLHRTTIVAPAASRAAATVVLTSNIPVAAERTILVTPAHAPGPTEGYTVGLSSPVVVQVLPDGNTGAGYQEYLMLQNGSGQVAPVGVEFYTPRGTAVHLDLTIPAHTRTVVVVNQVAGLPAGEHGAVVLSTGVPVFVEQHIVFAGLPAPTRAPRAPRAPRAAPRPPARRAQRSCPLLLPRTAFPPHMTQWASGLTTPNVGAVASGLQQAHYTWGYVLVTPDLYPNVAAAQRRYQQAVRLMAAGQQVQAPLIGQQMMVWVAGDEVTHYTITTLLLRVGTTVTEINVGAGGPVVAVASNVARAVSACG